VPSEADAPSFCMSSSPCCWGSLCVGCLLCLLGPEAGPIRFLRLSLGCISCRQTLRPSCPKGQRAFPQPHPALQLAVENWRCLLFPAEPVMGHGLAGGSLPHHVCNAGCFPLQRKACCTGRATLETRISTSEHRRWAPPAVADCQTFKPPCTDSRCLPAQQRSEYELVTLPLAAEQGTIVLFTLS